MKQKVKIIHTELANGRHLTLAAYPEVRFPEGGRRKRRREKPLHTLSIGYAIRNPQDKENIELGETIATGRAKNNPLMVMMFPAQYLPKEMVQSTLQVIADEFNKRMENYIPFSGSHGPDTNGKSGSREEEYREASVLPS